MSTVDDQTDQRARWRSKRHHMRLECRECDVICERVVHPWHCLKSGCEYVYAFEDSETMYFGCLWKVFSAEFNMAAFSDGVERGVGEHQPGEPGVTTEKGRLARRGQARRSLKAHDPYGPVRMTRAPRPQCHVRIEQAYDASAIGASCCNPTFSHQQFGTGGDTMKLTATPPCDPDDPRT